MQHNTTQRETNETTIHCDCNKKGQADDDEQWMTDDNKEEDIDSTQPTTIATTRTRRTT